MSFSTPRGTQDILPEDWPYWDFVLAHARQTAHLHGYRRIETPTFAETSLFTRTSGEGSDVVDKEMYTFDDRGGDSLTLRAEGTAPVMRAYLQYGMNRLPQPVKLYYVERVYRYDRPQRGRLREHHQFGCEAIGSEDAYVDVEMVALLHAFYRALGFTDLSLHLHSIGDQDCRPEYVGALVDYLRTHEADLAERDRERLDRNPLRTLDSKETRSQPVLAGAPRMLEYLCDACSDHWRRVRHGLDLLGIHYVIDDRLVRGLDYYTRTVFEFMPPGEGAQSTIGAGGRYDALSTAMGGPIVPGVGFGTGIERLVLNLKERDIPIPTTATTCLFIAHAGEGTEDAALCLAEDARAAGFAAQFAFDSRSLKAQMRQANGSGARFAAIIGEDELKVGEVTLRSLQSGEQERIPMAQVVERLRYGAASA